MKKLIALVLSLVMALSLCAPAWGADSVEVSDEAGIVSAFEKGGTYKLTKSVAMAENTRLIVDNGVSVTLDLGGNTLSSTNTTTATHNFLIDVHGGTLTISNGAIEYTHTGTNMGWNGATTAIDVTDGGVLNMSGVSVSVEGTDMNFAVHLNNWGTVTMDAQNCVFDATYCGVRVFNSGPDMNDVTIKNSTLKGGSRAFWVHNYGSADMGGKLWSSSSEIYDESKVLERLDLDIYNNGNTFEITGTAKSPIRYGFNSPIYFTEQGVRVTDVAKIGDAVYTSLQAAVDAVAEGGTIDVLVAGKTAVVNEAKTFTVTGEAATITAGVGYLLSEKDGVYTVTEYVAPPVVEEPKVEATPDVAAPTVDTTVDTSKMSETEKKVATDVVDALENTGAIKFDEKANDALSEAAAEVAENKKVEVTADDINELANNMNQTVTEEEVVVVVQTKFNVKVADVSVEAGETTVTLDITPVYQHVATTKDVVESGDEIKVGANAVAVSDVQKVTKKITEEVTITIAIPDVLVELAKDNGNKLYVTHKKTNGTKYVYEATVDVTAKTATFKNPNGFSEFSISATDSTAVKMNGMNYADLQSAINDLSKGATIEVLSGDHEVEIDKACAFKVKVADGATVKITAADDYSVFSYGSNGVYTYTVSKKLTGGYYVPTEPTTKVESAATFDAGIGLYVGMSVLSAMGGAVVIGKKRED